MSTQYLGEERLEGDNQYQCDLCGHRTDATRRMRLHALPPYLCFQLKRFVFDMQTYERKKVRALCDLCTTAMNKLRIVTKGVSGESSLTGAFRDARRFRSTRWYHSVPRATRTPLGFGMCPSFKDHSLSRRAKP
jgi:hypothetical protein